MSGERNVVRGLRPGEIAVGLPEAADAGIYFIGRIRTPFASLSDCPKNPREGQVEARIEVDRRYAAGLEGLQDFSHVIVQYWMDLARRDIVLQTPKHFAAPRGCFALRSPVRPNPISLSVVELIRIDANILTIKGIDCRDGTPLVDIKPYYASTDAVPHARRP